jgi:L-rhamnonate dehydratase
MSNSLQQFFPKGAVPNRRKFLFGAAAATALASSRTATFGAFVPVVGGGPLKIEAIELFELHGRYTEGAGVNRQSQVNPEDIYDDLRKPVYVDKPNGTKEVHATAIYMRIKTAGGIEGLYGPFEKSAAIIVQEDLVPFLIGKDALAAETLWDQMYRSDRQSRDGLFMMAISAVDNTLWDIRWKILWRSRLSFAGWPVAQIRRDVLQLSGLLNRA